MKWTDRLMSLYLPMPESAITKQTMEPFKGVGRLNFLDMPTREKGYGSFDDEKEKKPASNWRTSLVVVFACSVGLGLYSWLRPISQGLLVPGRSWEG